MISSGYTNYITNIFFKNVVIKLSPLINTRVAGIN